MHYKYHVAHSDEALPRIDPEIGRLTSEDIQAEYEMARRPLHFYFHEIKGADAQCTLLPNNAGLEIVITLQEGSQKDADSYLDGFLTAWNSMVPGLAMVVRKTLAAQAA